jgi:hypothetical protein
MELLGNMVRSDVTRLLAEWRDAERAVAHAKDSLRVDAELRARQAQEAYLDAVGARAAQYGPSASLLDEDATWGLEPEWQP